MKQGLCHRLKHILQGADPGKDHGHIQDRRKQTAHGNVLQDLRQGHKQQTGACPHIQPVREARGNNHQGRHQRRNGIKQCRMASNTYHILLFGQIGAVSNHTAASDGQRKESLSHGADPHFRVFQCVPMGREHKPIALSSTGQQRHTHRQHQEDNKKQRHHHFIGLFNTIGTQQQGQQRAHHHDYMVRYHRKILCRESLKPAGGIHRH